MDKCKSITNEFRQRELGYLFAEPIDPVADNLENYEKIVKNPMDFSTIINKINNNAYQSTKEWYNDMILVFQNAIDYYPEESCISLVSKYYLADFKKAAFGLNISSESEWMRNVKDVTQKLTKCFLHPPLDFGYSQKVTEIKNNLNSIPIPDESEVFIWLQKLNYLGSNNDTKCDLYGIFMDIGQIPPEKLSHPIDLEKVPPNVVKSLIQYAKNQ